MNILFALIVAAIVAGLLAVLKAKQAKPDDGLDFSSRDVLFTPAERSFLGVLEQALDSRYRVFGKVRLGDIVKPAKGLNPGKRTTAMNRINQKHVDFVVCAAADLALIGVIELDDVSHGRGDRGERDDFVDLALAMARIPVLHFLVRKGYAVPEVRTRLAEILPAGAQPDTAPRVQEAHVESASVQHDPTGPACPKCAADMVKRLAAKGPHAGKWFWACSEYPTCRQMVALWEG